MKKQKKTLSTLWTIVGFLASVQGYVLVSLVDTGALRRSVVIDGYAIGLLVVLALAIYKLSGLVWSQAQQIRGEKA
jgi:hypothetical protein